MPALDVLIGFSVADERGSSKIDRVETATFCAPAKKPDILENMNIYDAKGGYLGSTDFALQIYT